MRKIYQSLEDYFLLIAAVVVYIFVFFFNNDIFYAGLKSFWALFVQVAPIILLVFVLIFITSYFLNEDNVSKLFGEKTGWRSWALAIILGIISAGPIYAWYPLLADLRDKGMENSYVSVFLYNRAIKPQLLPIMIYYFGLVFVVVLTVYMVVASIINGYIVNKFVEEE